MAVTGDSSIMKSTAASMMQSEIPILESIVTGDNGMIQRKLND
jgi:hypothetical protein